jgi:hypothetical protein
MYSNLQNISKWSRKVILIKKEGTAAFLFRIEEVYE